MRIAIKKTKVFKFAELSEEQKQKAVEKLYDINVDYDWWDATYDDAKNIGLKITGFDIYRGYCNGDFIESAETTARKIKAEHGKTCETYKTAKAYLSEIKGRTGGEREDLDREFLQSLLEDYRIILKNDYEYQTSREAIIDTIEANEYEFTEKGEIYV